MIQSPVLIIGCPRSGTTLLYSMLSEIPDLWSIGYESKEIIEKYHHPRIKNWESGVLLAEDMKAESKEYILAEFQRQAASGRFWRNINQIRTLLRKTQISSFIKSQGRSTSPGVEIFASLPQSGLNLARKFVQIRNKLFPNLLPRKMQLLEKTPENCLRLSFLSELFPDARVIFLVRDGRTNVSSLMEGWRQPYLFPGYKVPEKIQIPGDTRGRWAFTLIPGWRELLTRPLAEVCAWQWVKCNQAVIDFLDDKNRSNISIQISYEELIEDSRNTLGKIVSFLGFSDKEIHLKYSLPFVNVVSSPDLDKWLKNKSEIEAVYPIIKPVMSKLGYVF